MAVVKGKLEQIVASAVNALGDELVGCEMLQSGKNTVLRVYVDAPDGINIDEITKVSQQISAVLDVEEPIAGKYMLEVSSPGLDRPLFYLKDYQRFLGKSVKLRLRVPKEGSRRNYVGVLTSVDDQTIVLTTESGEAITMDFNEIEKTNLIPEI